MNANMIFKWLRDPRYATDTPCFLPVEIVDSPRTDDQVRVNTRVWLAAGVTDMRRGFTTL
jgi:hypothetical protein